AAVGAGGGDPLPGVLLDADAGPVDGLLRGDEVAGEVDGELLGRLDAVFLGEGEDGVLGGVGRQDVGVGAGVVDVVHVAGEGDGHVEVLDAVGAAVPGDPDDAVLRLAVLVLSQDGGAGGSGSGGHGLLAPSVNGVAE